MVLQRAGVHIDYLKVFNFALAAAEDVEQRVEVFISILVVDAEAEALEVADVRGQLQLVQFLQRSAILDKFLGHA